MNIVAVLNQKGGVGKTTISIHLARAFQLDGEQTLFVDSDPQGTARDWSSIKEDQPLPTIALDRPTHARTLRTMDRYGWVIVDGPPQTSALTVSAMMAADMVLIPVRRGPFDVWALAELMRLFYETCEARKAKGMPPLRAAFVVNALRGTRAARALLPALERYGLPVLKTMVQDRVIYDEAFGVGSTVFDVEPDGLAAQEMRAVQAEVIQLMAQPAPSFNPEGLPA